MDLENFTTEISYPIETLKKMNEVFEQEVANINFHMSEDETKEFHKFLNIYYYTIQLLTENMQQINEKYKLKAKEAIRSC